MVISSHHKELKILRFMITGTDWADLSTLRVQYNMNNRDLANKLYLINPLAGIPLRRLRIFYVVRYW